VVEVNVNDSVRIVKNVFPTNNEKKYKKYIGKTGVIIGISEDMYEVKYNDKRCKPNVGYWLLKELEVIQ
jgi:ribosomal protein L21E